MGGSLAAAPAAAAAAAAASAAATSFCLPSELQALAALFKSQTAAAAFCQRLTADSRSAGARSGEPAAAR